MRGLWLTVLFSGSPGVISGETNSGEFGWNSLIDKVFLNAAVCISGGSDGAVSPERVRPDIKGANAENLKT